MSLPVADQYRMHEATRAIHGFAHVTHYPVLNHMSADLEGHNMRGHAALCCGEKTRDLLADNWAVRRGGLFHVVPKNVAGAALLVQTPAHRGIGRVSLDPKTACDGTINPLDRGFVFRAGLVIEIPEIRDQQAAGF